MAKTGRPRGVQNRASGRLLHKLTVDHRFDVVGKIVRLYEDNEKLLLSMRAKMDLNLENDKHATFGFEDAELALFNSLNKDQLTMLMKILAYCFPKLRSLDIQEGSSDKIIFNITGLTGGVSQQKQLPPNVVPIRDEG